MLSVFIYKAVDLQDIEALYELELPGLTHHDVVPGDDISSSLWSNASVVSFRFEFPDESEPTPKLTRACERRVNAALNSLGVRFLTPRIQNPRLADSLQKLINSTQTTLDRHDKGMPVEHRALEELLAAVQTISGMIQQGARELR
ncbi:hypothetical protein [Herbiconiux ginsengi]|uniref:hypothetical protein n=1 Tax=Herbiconiux ginsengi TaxID=381665 RepID=UPI001114A658|nr:hypothetical protein [Herbiconiux ginsengi]